MMHIKCTDAWPVGKTINALCRKYESAKFISLWSMSQSIIMNIWIYSLWKLFEDINLIDHLYSYEKVQNNTSQLEL